MNKLQFMAITDSLSETARKTPDKTAVICEDKAYSYAELDKKSDLLAAALCSAGIKIERESYIAFILNRSFFVPVTIMGILKTGAAFIPFTPDTPAERLRYCMKDAGCKIVITTEKLKSEKPELQDSSYLLLTVEELLSRAERESLKKPCVQIQEKDAAMCIFTSGSTGKPKGVISEHGAIFKCLGTGFWAKRMYKDAECICGLAPIVFIIFYIGFYSSIYSGLEYYLNTESELKDLKRFSGNIYRHKIEFMAGVPSFFDMLFSIASSDELRCIKTVLLGGEAFTFKQMEKLREKNPAITIIQGYGATETSVVVTKEIRGENDFYSNGLPYLSNAYITDENGNEVADGEKGELLIQTDFLARGYMNLPQETAEKFITFKGKKTYKTGDLAYRNEDGEIVLCGRMDDMVKLNGQRIELPEIEKNLLAIDGIHEARVLLKREEKGAYLEAFLSPESGISSEEIKKRLSETLPPYMIPTFFVRLEKLPRNENGKIDRHALLAIKTDAAEKSAVFDVNQIEKILLRTVKKVLELSQDISMETDFFSLDGSSITALELVVELEKSNISLSVMDIYRERTCAHLAAFIKNRLKSGGKELTAEEHEEACRKKTYKVMPEQTFFLSSEEAQGGVGVVYNYAFYIPYGKDIDVQKLCSAIDTVIKLHPIFSSVCTKTDAGDYCISYHPEFTGKTEISEISEKDFASFCEGCRPSFRLFEEPLMRRQLFVTEKNVYFVIEMNHAIFDGYSWDLLISQVFRAYNGESLPTDFFYTHLQALQNQSESYSKAKSYYEHLKNGKKWCGILPYDCTKPFGKLVHLSFSTGVSLKELAQAEKKLKESRNILLLTAFLLTMTEITEKQHVCLAWTYDNRKLAQDVESSGCYLENLPVFVDFNKVQTYSELLTEVAKQVSNGILYSDYLDAFLAEDEKNDLCLLEINYQRHFDAVRQTAYQQNKPVTGNLIETERICGFPVVVEVWENSSHLNLYIEYGENIYEADNILRFARLFKKHFRDILSLPAEEPLKREKDAELNGGK